MYYIYKIAYNISDEMKAQKDAEKPFWWEHVHHSVKELPIEEIEKRILAGGVPAEKLAEMTKHEKYLAISEGCYVVDCEKAEQANAELESLKKEVERSKTSFLGQPTGSQPQNQPSEQETFEPIEFGKKPVSNIQSPIPSNESTLTPSAVPNEGGVPPLEFPAPAPSSTPDLGGGLKENDIFGGALKGDNLGSPGGSNPNGKAELRRHAQSIVSKVVSEVNTKADGIPDDVALMKEQELLQAVIQELQTLR